MSDERQFHVRHVNQARGDLYAIADDLGISEGTAGANPDAKGAGPNRDRNHLLLSGARHSVDGILHPLMGACVTGPLSRIGRGRPQMLAN